MCQEGIKDMSIIDSLCGRVWTICAAFCNYFTTVLIVLNSLSISGILPITSIHKNWRVLASLQSAHFVWSCQKLQTARVWQDVDGVQIDPWNLGSRKWWRLGTSVTSPSCLALGMVWHQRRAMQGVCWVYPDRCLGRGPSAKPARVEVLVDHHSSCSSSTLAGKVSLYPDIPWHSTAVKFNQ